VTPFDKTAGIPADNKEFGALISSLKDLAIQIVNKSPNIPSEAAFAIKNIESPAFVVHLFLPTLTLNLQKNRTYWK